MMREWIFWAVKGTVLMALLMGASYRDIRSRKVPDFYSALILLIALFTPDIQKWWGIFCAMPFLTAALTIGGIGGADIKIMGAAGMVLGFWEGLSAMSIGLAGMLLYHMGTAYSERDSKNNRPIHWCRFWQQGLFWSIWHMCPDNHNSEKGRRMHLLPFSIKIKRMKRGKP